MPTYGHDSLGGVTSQPDYRELINRLGWARRTGTLLTLTPDECWILTMHIEHLSERARQST